jgi:hypothetical protein
MRIEFMSAIRDKCTGTGWGRGEGKVAVDSPNFLIFFFGYSVRETA